MATQLLHDLVLEHSATSSAKSMQYMHEHSFYELYFLVSGRRRYLMRDTVYDVEPGDLVLIPKNQLHRAVSATKAGYDRYVVYFSQHRADLLNELLGRETFNTLINQGCLHFPAPIFNELLQEMKELHRILTTLPPFADALSTHLFQGIMLRALQFGVKKERLTGETAEKVQLATQYISQNYREEITLAGVAEMVGFEKTYFSRIFKNITGFGFQDYLLQTRILAAEQLLKDPALSINEVAEACGFSGGNYFGDVFRRYRGISPSEYRKKDL